MATSIEFVGKLGGGLAWNKVSGAQKTINYSDSLDARVLVKTNLTVGKLYILAARYNYISGTPGTNSKLYIGENRNVGSTTTENWSMTGTGPVTQGKHFYEFAIVQKLSGNGEVFVQFSPQYNSGTHTLSADLYYSEFGDIPE
ncbi:hypothetical protein [Corynebacterium provencense]|uniref:hypothetical protein n=1 Tax=Corynebacterium provencense TaxID=1737425 RepID=UPI000B264EA6|nr:hypothetical protein [Corynebacterium provencense]